MAVIDIRVRRVYDEPSPQDGLRVLVDRIWPRGLRKDAAHQHDPARFDLFRQRYLAELAQPGPRP